MRHRAKKAEEEKKSSNLKQQPIPTDKGNIAPPY